MNNIENPTPCFEGIREENLIPNHVYVARKTARLYITCVSGNIDICRNGTKSPLWIAGEEGYNGSIFYMISKGDTFSINTRGVRQIVITGTPMVSDMDIIKEELKDIKNKIENIEYENKELRKQLLRDL